jgi:hypothetical protein
VAVAGACGGGGRMWRWRAHVAVAGACGGGGGGGGRMWRCRYSDDSGVSWSSDRLLVPYRLTSIDKKNEWGGNVTIMWTVDTTKTRDGTVYVPRPAAHSARQPPGFGASARACRTRLACVLLISRSTYPPAECRSLAVDAVSRTSRLACSCTHPTSAARLNVRVVVARLLTPEVCG